MTTILAVVAVALGLKVMVIVRRHAKFIQLRFKLFALRDEILWLAANGVISEQDAVLHYNNMNWTVRYVREFPVFFLLGLAATFEAMDFPDSREALRKKLDGMPDELKRWYSRFSDLTLEGIKTYTPVGTILRFFKYNGVMEIAALGCAIWLFFMMMRLSRHPLRRAFLSRLDLAQVKKESIALSRTRRKAEELRELTLSPVT